MNFNASSGKSENLDFYVQIQSRRHWGRGESPVDFCTFVEICNNLMCGFLITVGSKPEQLKLKQSLK